MKYRQDMAIVIVSCDAYLDVMKEYMRYFKMNWPDCPYELIVVTETLNLKDDRVYCITAGNDIPWTKRAILGINSTNCPYILMSMDDGFLSEKVNTEEVVEIVDFIKNNSIKYYRNPKRKYKCKKNPVFASRNNVYKIRKNEIYGIDFGHNIWERNTILSLLGDGTKSAWQIEEYLNEIALNSEPGYYEDMVSDKNNFLHIIETVSGGKWMPTEINRLKNLGIPVNIGKRGVLPKSDSVRRKIHQIASSVVPPKQRKNVKRVLSKLGYKFVTKN